jgi:hypothetical protein
MNILKYIVSSIIELYFHNRGVIIITLILACTALLVMNYRNTNNIPLVCDCIDTSTEYNDILHEYIKKEY